MNTGWAVWLTGVPAAGKTTLAHALKQSLNERNITAVVLDSDEIRRLLMPDLGYTPVARDQFYERLGALAVLLTQAGVNVIIAATAHRRTYRDQARAQIKRFIEIWVHCSLDVCQARDPKGVYAQAQAGRLHDVPGLQVLFEPPNAPELMLDTTEVSPEQAVTTILRTVPMLTAHTYTPVFSMSDQRGSHDT